MSHWYARLNPPWLIHNDTIDVCRQLKHGLMIAMFYEVMHIYDLRVDEVTISN